MTKKRIYYVLAIFLFISTISRIQTVKGHPPSGLILSYHINSGQLNATISHTVSGQSHYVELVTVKVNGSTVITQGYISQPGNLFTYNYTITAEIGAEIHVTAECSQGGSISTCIKVGGGFCGQNGGGQIPGYLGFWLIIGVSVIALLVIIHKKIKH